MTRDGLPTESSRRPFASAGRAVAPAIGKTLEIGFGVLLVALLATTLYGDVVPGYRTVAGDELADRSLSQAITATERAIPPDARVATTTVEVQLPPTIRGATYEIHAVDDTLELRHPHPGIDRTVRLAVPAHDVSVTGTWRSTDPLLVTARTTAEGVRIAIGGTDA